MNIYNSNKDFFLIIVVDVAVAMVNPSHSLRYFMRNPEEGKKERLHDPTTKNPFGMIDEAF